MPDEDSLYSTFATFEPGCMLSELRCLSILTCVGTRGLWRCCPCLLVAVMPTILASKSPPKRGEGQGGDNKAEEMSASACARACACACA